MCPQAGELMFRKHQVSLFRDEAFFEVPDLTQPHRLWQSPEMHIRVCTRMCVTLFWKELKPCTDMAFPTGKHHKASTDLGDPYHHNIWTSGSLGWQNGAMWPAFTAQRLSWPFIYLSGDGTDIILTVSGLLVSFKHYRQRKYQKKKNTGQKHACEFHKSPREVEASQTEEAGQATCFHSDMGRAARADDPRQNW